MPEKILTSHDIVNDFHRVGNVVYDINIMLGKLMEEVKSPPSEFYYYHGLARVRKSILESLLRLLADIDHIFVSAKEESEFFKQVSLEVEKLTELINDGEEIIKQNKDKHTRQH